MSEALASADTVRLVPATADMAPLVPPLMLETNPHLWAYYFAGDYEAFAKFAELGWRQDAGVFSHKHATAAVLGDDLAGLCLSYTARLQSQQAAASQAAVIKGIEHSLIEHFMQVQGEAMYLQPAIPDDALYVFLLSTTEQARGRGVGAKLLTNAFNQAKEAGLKSVHLDVYAANPAVRFYERMEMAKLVEVYVPSLETHGISTHYRMVKQLG